MEHREEQRLVRKFFAQHPLVTVSTLSSSGIPEHSAMYLYMDGIMDCYIATRETTRKYENIKNNNVVVISTHDEDVLMFAELQCEAEIVEDAGTIADILPKLQEVVFARKPGYWIPPVAQLEGEHFVFIRCTPKKVTFVNYDDTGTLYAEPHRITFEM
ncbi:MAG: Pyridoxamine 5-phosphate oxidase [Candidatus Parcubacteria bacterium]|jgi:general stress protein 26